MRALLLLALAACDSSWGYGTVIRPVPDEPRWRTQVTLAAEQWNEALGLCQRDFGPALSVQSVGHPVRLVKDIERKDAAGVFTGEDIQIKEDLKEWELPVLVHELGHSLGFDHVTEESDPDSIMNPTIGPGDRISAGDVRHGHDFFGCR